MKIVLFVGLSSDQSTPNKQSMFMEESSIAKAHYVPMLDVNNSLQVLQLSYF